MVLNTKKGLAAIFVFVLIATVGVRVVQSQADIDGTPKPVQQNSNPAHKHGNANLSMISPDGRFVTFQSYASNLVDGDTNDNCNTDGGLRGSNCPDIFLFDRELGQVLRISVDSDGSQGNAGSAYSGTFSADGRFMAYASASSNLVEGDTNQMMDIFFYDQLTGEASRVSLSSAGTQANQHSHQPALSEEGRYVAFATTASNLVAGDTNGMSDIYVHDRLSGETGRVSVSSAGFQGDGHSYQPTISGDGRLVAFYSQASNLVLDDSNRAEDIFLHDRSSGQTIRISISSAGMQGDSKSYQPYLSRNGRYVAFSSDASNLVADDSNGTYDIFVHDLLSGETTRVSVASDGTQASGGNFGSHYPFISADGRYLTFGSFAPNLAAGADTGFVDIYVHDRLTGETSRASIASDGAQGNFDSYSPSSISDDGRYVAFCSDASNLVPDDNNGFRDIFVHDRLTGLTERISAGHEDLP